MLSSFAAKNTLLQDKLAYCAWCPQIPIDMPQLSSHYVKKIVPPPVKCRLMNFAVGRLCVNTTQKYTE